MTAAAGAVNLPDDGGDCQNNGAYQVGAARG
jgi:hypothetical protein